MLARTKLNSIESKISEAFINNEIQKSKFIKNQKAKGLLIDLGVRTPLSKASILGNILFWTHAELYIKTNEIVNFFSFNNFYQVVINLCQKCI